MAMEPPDRRPLRVFYSYAHADERHRQRLEQHLSMLKHQGVITMKRDNPCTLPNS